MIVKHQLVIISLYHICATEIPYDTSCWKSNLSLIYALQISLMERGFPKPTFIELEIIGDVHLPLQISSRSSVATKSRDQGYLDNSLWEYPEHITDNIVSPFLNVLTRFKYSSYPYRDHCYLDTLQCHESKEHAFHAIYLHFNAQYVFP
jgi:hypothetical protein